MATKKTTTTTKGAVIGTGKTQTFADQITAFANERAKADANLQRKASEATATANAFTKDADAERAKLSALIDGWRSGSTDGTAAELAEHQANIARLGYLTEGATAKANQAQKARPNTDASGAKVVADAIDRATEGYWSVHALATNHGVEVPLPSADDLTSPIVVVTQPKASVREANGSFSTSVGVTVSRKAHIHGVVDWERVREAAEAAGQIIETPDQEGYGLQPEPDENGVVHEGYRVKIRRGADDIPEVVTPLADYDVDELHQAVEPLLSKLNEGNSDALHRVNVSLGKSTKRPGGASDVAVSIDFRMAIAEAPKFANPSQRLRERLEDDADERNDALAAMEARGFRRHEGPVLRTGISDAGRTAFDLAAQELNNSFVPGVGRVIGVSTEVVASESGDRYTVKLVCRRNVAVLSDDEIAELEA